VVIDEALGRGSDESARFGLDLFAKQGPYFVLVRPAENKSGAIVDSEAVVFFVTLAARLGLACAGYRARRIASGSRRNGQALRHALIAQRRCNVDGSCR
jgi:hypothetical protein